MYDFYVVWKTDEDDYFVTKLMFSSIETAKSLSVQDFVEMAFDAEYPNMPNSIIAAQPYECITIFYGNSVLFIE